MESYSRRCFLQEYDIGVEFREAALQLGHGQVGGDDEEAFALVVLAAVELGEGQALELETKQFVQQIHPIDSPADVAAENHIDGRVGIIPALPDLDGQLRYPHRFVHTDGIEEGDVVAVKTEIATVFLSHHAMAIAHHEHGEALLDETRIDGTDNLARMCGIFDGLVEADFVVFLGRFHIVLQLLSTIIIRMTFIKNFYARF